MPVLENQQCGVFNSTQGSWQSMSCESALPYICKKTSNYSRNAEPLGKEMSYLTAYSSFLSLIQLFCPSIHPFLIAFCLSL